MKYGPAGGSCNTSTATATRTFILVNGVSEYQWKAQLTGLAADTEYCYRALFRQRAARPAGHRPVAGLPHPDPRRVLGAVQVRRVRRLGQDAGGRQPGPGKRDLADRRQRRALRRHDRRQRLRGRQPEGLRRPLPDRGQHERRLRPQLLEGRGGVDAAVPGDRQPRSQQLRAAHELAAGHRRGHLRRALPDRHLLLPERHHVRRLSERLVRVRRRAWRASTCSPRLGTTPTSARRARSRTTSTTTGGRAPRSTSGSRTTSPRTRAPCGSRSGTTRSTPTAARPGPTRSCRDRIRSRGCWTSTT